MKGKSPYAATFVKEVNYPARMEVLPSQTLIKTWQVRNDGTTAWPQGTKLLYLRGTLPSVENDFEVGLPGSSVEVGQTVDVSVVVRTPAERGRYHAVFRFVDTNGLRFGPRLWCDLKVVKADDAPDASSSSSASSAADTPDATPVQPVDVASAASAAGAASTASAASTVLADTYVIQLCALKAMGWDNDELNLYLLKENDGDVQRVCHWLLEQMKP